MNVDVLFSSITQLVLNFQLDQQDHKTDQQDHETAADTSDETTIMKIDGNNHVHHKMFQ